MAALRTELLPVVDLRTAFRTNACVVQPCKFRLQHIDLCDQVRSLLEQTFVLLLRLALVLHIIAGTDFLINGLERLITAVDHAAYPCTGSRLLGSICNFPCHFSHVVAHFPKLITKIHFILLHKSVLLILIRSLLLYDSPLPFDSRNTTSKQRFKTSSLPYGIIRFFKETLNKACA